MNTEQLSKLLRSFRWLPAYALQRLTHRPQYTGDVHLMIAVADHFEPSHRVGPGAGHAELSEQERRLEDWCRDYPKIMSPWRDSDGRPFVHTYFSPAEQYHSGLIARLADHCQAGWGEIEVHLHHGLTAPDTSEGARQALLCFRDALMDHGCLSRWNGEGPARYGFVHGNWALANCFGGRYCGVDDEMQILADTGCYADFTYPSAPSPTQIGKINSVYECTLPLNQRAPQRRGRDLKVGRAPETFPLMVQGPLTVDFTASRGGRKFPVIENSALTTARPPSMRRLTLWRDAAITVAGRPDWVFIKLHCHGMDPRDQAAMVGDLRTRFLEELTRESGAHRLHFVTGREMVNILLAACDGREGNPNEFRDYRLRLITPVKG